VFLERIEGDRRFAPVQSALQEYLRQWGFRCSGELMLTEESFCDAPEKFIDLLRGYIDQPGGDPEKIIGEKAAERRRLMGELRRRLLRGRGLLAPVALAEIGGLQLLVRLCFSGIASRERVRLKQAGLYHSFKNVVRRIGGEFVRRGLIDDARDIFYLRYQEIAENLTTSDMLSGTLKALVEMRKREFEESSKLQYPDDFSSIAGEYPLPGQVLTGATGQAPERSPGEPIRGLSACGGYVRGRVRVLQSVMELSRIRKGDILVTRQTDPGWATVFPLISGLIVERGGMLSHGAIVAREFGIPAIIGVPHATAIFVDGEEIELNGDRGEIYRTAPLAHPAIETTQDVDVSDDRTLHPTAM
jgi:pyruvate,water dikinase